AQYRDYGFVAAKDESADAAIAPVVNENAVAGIGHVPRQRLHVVEGAPAAGRERDPRAARAEDFVVDVRAAHVGDGHRFPPSFPGAQSIRKVGAVSTAVRRAGIGPAAQDGVGKIGTGLVVWARAYRCTTGAERCATSSITGRPSRGAASSCASHWNRPAPTMSTWRA